MEVPMTVQYLDPETIDLAEAAGAGPWHLGVLQGGVLQGGVLQ